MPEPMLPEKVEEMARVETDMQAVPEKLTSNSIPRDEAVAANTKVEMSPDGDDPDAGVDDGYRPISLLAPLTLFFAFCSLFAIFGLFWVTMAGIGTLTGLFCLWRIRRSEGALGGRTMGLVATGICALMCCAGGSYQSYLYATEVPEGYERLDFEWLAQQQPIFMNGKYHLPEELQKMNGKKVYVKGYMYPTGDTINLSSFLLCKDTRECCFGGNPKPSDVIMVNFVNGVTADFRELILVGVAGTLRIDPIHEKGELQRIYVLEGTHFR